MNIADLIALLGGVALFLFGMSLMGEGLKKAAGNKMELVLYQLSATTLKGILLGTAVTAVIQSSSATSVMVVGFVNSGMMALSQAISIIMGANIGTSVTGWIIALSELAGNSGSAGIFTTATLTGLIAVIGTALRIFSKKQRKRQIGEIMLGFSVLMYGIDAMGRAVEPLRESAVFVRMITQFSNPGLGILAGILITVVLQSASSSVGLLQTMTVTGIIDFRIAFPILLGIAIGASSPVLISALGANEEAKRSAWAYLVVNLIGAAFFGSLFYVLDAVLDWSFSARIMTALSIALINTTFRVATTVICIPLMGPIQRLLRWMIPSKTSDDESAVLPRLEERFLSNPEIALKQCQDMIFSMAQATQKNLLRSLDLLKDYSEEQFRVVQDRENLIDRYEDRLGSYLVLLTQREMNAHQTQEATKYLHTIGDLERIADHAVNISECAQEIYEKKIVFSEEGEAESQVVQGAVTKILDLAITAFIQDDREIALRVEPLEEVIDDLTDAMKLRHVERLGKGLCKLENGFVFNDLITNYERVSDHCSNIAVALIELDAGAFDTHEYLESIKQLRDQKFENYYKEYSKEYTFA